MATALTHTIAEIEQFKRELFNELVSSGERIEDARAECECGTYAGWSQIMDCNTPQSYADLLMM